MARDAWHLWHCAGGSLVCWGAALFCVAGVALGDMDISCEQVWQLVTWMFTLCRPVLWQVEWHLMTWMSLWCGRRSTSLLVAILCGRDGTWSHGGTGLAGGALCCAAPRCFVWQVWHLRHWAGSGVVASTSLLCGRRGTW